jgi:hypothetical protein
MNSWQIAANLRWQASQFKYPVFILLDYSKMDAHLRELLRECVEWSTYLKAFASDAFLRFLLGFQRRNKVRSMNDLFWYIVATMMSGEYNTSLGDTLINDAITAYMLRMIKHGKLLNGDDGVIIVERADLDRVDYSWFTRFGMNAKVEVVDDFTKIKFCQCQPIRVNGVWRMVRDPNRVLSKSSYTIKTLSGNAWTKLVGAIGLGELSCNTGVPILQSFAHLLYRSAGCKTSAGLLNDYMYMRHDKITTKREPVTNQSRLDFNDAFGISPDEQRGLESMFDSIILPILL